MYRLIAIVTVVVTGIGPSRADDVNTFVGEWKTTMGPVTLTQKGGDVSGQIVFFKLALKGKADGKKLTVGYDEGATHVDATLELQPSGNAFQGTFRASNGNRGVWNGWRPDAEAAKSKAVDVSGLWLTDLGLMELKTEGTKVSGRYALRGTSSLDGDVKGRHLELRIKAMRTGPAWFDVSAKGDTLTGAGGTDGMPGWYAWTGRKATEFVRHAPLAAGKIVDGSTEGLLTYTVRAPDAYKAGDTKNWPAVLILHGSNMNGRAYVNTLASAWPDIARDYILLGINGELPSNLSPEGPAFNYSYVNYVGRSKFKGFPGTDRESPALVREAMDELKKVYPIKHYFVGGHSQGGYLTYSILMNSPEAIAGAFPVSAEVIFQCEPSAYTDEKLKAAQRAVPLAIVHGKTDPLVPFDSGAYSAGLFLDAGWPAMRFFTDPDAAHMFGRLPVGPAIRWLETMASTDPAVLLDFAERRLKESGYRDAIAAARRARTLTLDSAGKARLDRVLQGIDAKAAPQAKTYLAAIKANKDNKWIDGFLTFRNEFEHADAAADAMAAFQSLRERDAEPALKLIGEARGFFQQGRRDDGYAKAQEVVDKYYASPSYRLAKKWAAERK
jgi:predicted esterase